MTGEIRLVNRGGRLVAIDTETNETVPIQLGPIEATSTSTTTAQSTHAFTYGNQLADFAAGRITGSRYASWTMMLEQTLASYPVQKTKPTLMFHSEGGRLEEYEEALPRMVERNLPWEVGIGDSTAFQAELEKTNRISPEQAREIQFNGGEIGLYSGEVEALPEEASPWALADEQWELGEAGPGQLDPENDGRSLERLQRLLLGQKRHVEQRVGVPVSFMTARQGSTINFGELDMAKSYMIRSLYQASGHGGAQGRFQGADSMSVFARTSPHTHASTILDDVSSESDVAEITAIIDDLLHTTDRCMLFFHSHNVSNWEAIETILDYAMEKRDNGELDIASATGGLLLPWDLEAGDIVNENSPHYDDFEDCFWTNIGNTPAVSDNQEYWRMGAGLGSDDHGGVVGRRVRTNPVFPTFMVQADVRTPSETTAEASIKYDLSGLETTDQQITRTFAVGNDWQTVRTPFGHPRADVGDPNGATTDELGIFTTDPELHVKNIKVYPC